MLWAACCLAFIKQARVGLWPARTWFLKIDPVQIVGMRMCVCVCVCVCPRPSLLTTSGVMWHDIDHIQLDKHVLQLLYGDCSCYH